MKIFKQTYTEPDVIIVRHWLKYYIVIDSPKGWREFLKEEK
jgi:hypothetical protein